MGKLDDLYISVPSFFRCPISLEVMKSPVSLCTGVTYDRTSIQRWLDTGNNTCPATMQILESRDLVPNHTLQRLIQIWSKNGDSNNNYKKVQFHQSLSCSCVSDLIRRLISLENEIGKDHDDDQGSVLFDGFVKILCFASERAENRRFLASNKVFVGYLTRIVCWSEKLGSGMGPGTVLNPDILEAGLKLLHLIMSCDVGKDEKSGKKMVIKSWDLVCSLTRIVKTGGLGSKVAAVGILESLAQDPESKKIVFDQQELVLELLQMLKRKRTEKEMVSEDRELRQEETRAVLSCLISLSAVRTNKKKLVRAGGVKIIGELLISLSASPWNNNSTNKIAGAVIIELMLILLETLVGLAEGRAAISDEQYIVPVIINKMMKVSKAANEHGVALLWSLCYLFRDQRAKDAVIRSNGGLTKILLLMQSDCSPAVKKMCCDLLRIFRVNSKSCLSSYDTKTTHIMPC